MLWSVSGGCQRKGQGQSAGGAASPGYTLAGKVGTCRILQNSPGKDVLLHASTHLDLFPESTMEASLDKHYTIRPINVKMLYISDVCAAYGSGHLLGENLSTHKSKCSLGS